MAGQNQKDTWRQRRRFLIFNMLFSMGIIVFALYRGEDLRIFETAINMAFAHLTLIFGAYVGGAVYEDTSHAKVNGHGSNGGNN